MSANDTTTPSTPLSPSSNRPRGPRPRDGYSNPFPSPTMDRAHSFVDTPFLPQTVDQTDGTVVQDGVDGQAERWWAPGFRRHRHKKWFQWIFWGVSLVVLVTLVTALFFWYFHVNSEVTSHTAGAGNFSVSLIGKVTNVDTTVSKVSVEWEIKTCYSPEMVARNCSAPYQTINVFMDGNCSDFTQQLFFNTNLTDPALRIGNYNATSQRWRNNTSQSADDLPWIDSGFEQSFQADVPFRISKLVRSKRANLLAYPFDRYETKSLFCASFFEFTSFAGLNYPVVNYTAEYWAPLTVELGGDQSRSAAISSWTIDSEDCPASDDPKEKDRKLTLAVRRSGIVIFFAAAIWLTNWAITSVVLAQAALVFVWKKEMSESLVLVPLTALFSMPAVRSVAPGAPQFGSYYDTTGFNTQISLVSICTAAILAHTLYNSEHVWTRAKTGADGGEGGRGGAHGGGRRGKRAHRRAAQAAQLTSSPFRSNTMASGSGSESGWEDHKLTLGGVPTLAYADAGFGGGGKI